MICTIHSEPGPEPGYDLMWGQAGWDVVGRVGQHHLAVLVHRVKLDHAIDSHLLYGEQLALCVFYLRPCGEASIIEMTLTVYTCTCVIVVVQNYK